LTIKKKEKLDRKNNLNGLKRGTSYKKAGGIKHQTGSPKTAKEEKGSCREKKREDFNQIL